jgi:Tfp pilus assembly protein PilP
MEEVPMTISLPWVCVALVVGAPASPSPTTESHTERQAICEAHTGRSWNHFLETTCLADLSLRGIVKARSGYKALLESGTTKATFTAEVGAFLYDGIVESIDGSSVTIRQTIGDNALHWQAQGSDTKTTRLVRRPLRDEKEQPR